MKKRDLTLPEWAFLEATSHLGDPLKGRDVLLHVRTNTMLEFFNSDDMQVQMNSDVKQDVFGYRNKYGTMEQYIIAVHFSLAHFEDLNMIIEKAITFFCDWMDWMDKTIEVEDNSKHN